MQLVKVPNDRLLWGLSALILVGAFIASPGFFSIDEAIYYLGARAVAEWGSLGINNNGFDQFHSEALKIRGLVAGPQGLTPQYPAGSALLAGLILPLFGPKAFTLLNAVAAILTFFTVRRICISQFKSEIIGRLAVAMLVLGTFWVEYALGQWPHVVSVYFSTQAYWFALRHFENDGDDYRCAILAGLFAGLGMLIRLDAVLAVPAIGLIMVMFARRFVRSSFLFALGVLPSIALASWFNFLKFGTLNPFSYGKSGGNADLAAYGPLIGALAVGFGALILWRKIEWRMSRRATMVAALILGVCLLLMPATRDWLMRFWNGFSALVLDARNIEEHRVGVEQGPGQTILFWGLTKKSLGQSMPWIGIMAMLLTNFIRRDDRRSFAMLSIFTATMMMPFILLSWHGGGGSNMRYFLPALPMISIICAKLLADLWASLSNPMSFAASGVWAALALSLAWIILHPSRSIGVQQILSTYVLLAMALTSVAAGLAWRFTQVSREIAISLFAAGFTMSMTFALADFVAAAERRASNYGPLLALEKLPAKSLVIVAYPEWTGIRLPGNGSIVAADDSRTRQTDPQLIFDALDAGYRVFMPVLDWEPARKVPQGIQTITSSYWLPGGQIIELRRVPTIVTSPHRSDQPV
jgi:hypothetical protein